MTNKESGARRAKAKGRLTWRTSGLEGKEKKEVMSVKQEAVGGMQWQQCGVMGWEGEGVPPFLHHAPRGWRYRRKSRLGLT